VAAIVDIPVQAAALEAFLDAQGLGAGPLSAAPVGEGHSNLTYEIRRGGEAWVLRRPPRGPLPPSAHDVLREATLLRAVERTAARTPRVVAVCDDDAVIGAPFYVMQRVEGDVIVRAVPEGLDRRAIGMELVDALAEVHAIDWRACGLEGYGRPSGYLDRQLRRFSGLWEHNRTRELPTLERVTAWLSSNRPESGDATIVHGDYRLGNVMFAPGAPARLAAIFDWELATIGDPLADVGYLLATWAQPGDPESVVSELAGITREPGFPTRDELVAHYEARAGRSMRDVRWYMTLAMWKTAVFLERSYKRRLAGTTDDAFFDLLEQGVPQISERAWQIAAG
jgi:aminoglycoside phosphotransferase (APT) family kinase protein